MTLKQLHLQFCGLTSASGVPLADLLAFSKSSLEWLNVSGNKIGGLGLRDLCKGLIVNTKCATLGIADNAIDQVGSDIYVHIYFLYMLCYICSIFVFFSTSFVVSFPWIDFSREKISYLTVTDGR